MEDSDPQIRALAENIGITIEDPRAVGPLLRLLDHEDWWTRYCAAQTLGRIRDPRAFAPLVEILKNEESRLCAIEALGFLKDARAIEPLGKLLPSADLETKLEIVEAFRNIKHPGALPYLKALIQK